MPSADCVNLYVRWVTECQNAVGDLRVYVKRAKAYRSQCWDVFEAALSVVKTMEQVVYVEHLDLKLTEELPDLFAAAVSTIEMAQALVQVMNITLAFQLCFLAGLKANLSLQSQHRSVRTCRCTANKVSLHGVPACPGVKQSQTSLKA